MGFLYFTEILEWLLQQFMWDEPLLSFCPSIFPRLLEITSSPPPNLVNSPVLSKVAFLLHVVVSQPMVSKVISRAASRDSLGWVSYLVALLECPGQEVCSSEAVNSHLPLCNALPSVLFEWDLNGLLDPLMGLGVAQRCYLVSCAVVSELLCACTE